MREREKETHGKWRSKNEEQRRGYMLMIIIDTHTKDCC